MTRSRTWAPSGSPWRTRCAASYKLVQQTGIRQKITYGSSGWACSEKGTHHEQNDGMAIARRTYVFDKDKRLQCSNLTEHAPSGEELPLEGSAKDGRSA